MLQDLDAGVRYQFNGDRLVLGSGATADVHLQVDADNETALWLHDDGEIALHIDRESEALFMVGIGRRERGAEERRFGGCGAIRACGGDRKQQERGEAAMALEDTRHVGGPLGECCGTVASARAT